MKLFTKLALVSAVAAASTGAFALEALDDATMAKKTGQDGITITIQPANTGVAWDATTNNFKGISIEDVFIHDTDGLQAGTGKPVTTAITGAAGKSGVININDVKVKLNGNTKIVVDTEGGATAGNADAFINANIQLAAADIKMGAVTVGESAAAKVGIVRGLATGATAGTPSQILSGLTVSLGASTLNVQLGNQPQGAMAVLTGTVTGGLALKDLGLSDKANANFASVTGLAKGAGDLYIGQLQLADSGSTNLTNNIHVGIDDDEGLWVVMKTPTAGLDLALERVGFVSTASNAAAATKVTFGSYNPVAGTPVAMTRAGTAKFIGDVYMKGLKMGDSVISINGH